MTSDANKGITSITYNHLNLPVEVKFDNNSNKRVAYVYDATGAKLKKSLYNNSSTPTTTTDYASGYVYENNILQFFNHPEGYVDVAGGYKYIYHYKDHLDNVRLSYSDADGNGSIDPSTEIIKESNYYPFGLRHSGYNGNVSSLGNAVAKRYMFGGKEYQDESIGGNYLNWYDISARNYDPALGRWMNLDPLAEKFVETSPYAYAKNNPIFFVDPNGEEPVPGPFTGAGWRQSNGTIVVHRITAGQRYALNVYYATSVTFGGGVGTAVGVYDSAKIITNPRETTQTRVGVATQLALDGASSFMLSDAAAQGFGDPYKTASGKMVDNAKNIKNLAKGVKGGLGAIGIAAALTSDSSPTRNELISKWTFQFADSFIKGGNINIAQEGLFNVYDENATVEGTESRLNAIHAGINIFLAGTDFDLDTEQGQADAAKYITDNAKYVAALTRYIYNYYNNKEEEEND